MGTEFLSPYPYPWDSHGIPIPTAESRAAVVNFYPHTHTHGIPMGIPIPTAESRVAVVTEFLYPYPYPWDPMGIPIPTADLKAACVHTSSRHGAVVVPQDENRSINTPVTLDDCCQYVTQVPHLSNNQSHSPPA